jgi:hypothetical protein
LIFIVKSYQFESSQTFGISPRQRTEKSKLISTLLFIIGPISTIILMIIWRAGNNSWACNGSGNDLYVLALIGGSLLTLGTTSAAININSRNQNKWSRIGVSLGIGLSLAAIIFIAVFALGFGRCFVF